MRKFAASPLTRSGVPPSGYFMQAALIREKGGTSVRPCLFRLVPRLYLLLIALLA